MARMPRTSGSHFLVDGLYASHASPGLHVCLAASQIVHTRLGLGRRSMFLNSCSDLSSSTFKTY